MLPIKKKTQKFNTAKDLNPRVLLNVILYVLPDRDVVMNREEAIICAARTLVIKRVCKKISHEFFKTISRGINRELLIQGEEDSVSRV